MDKKIFTLLILAVLLVSGIVPVYADNFFTGWVKQKLKIGNPEYQCEINILNSDDCLDSSTQVQGSHICQLYRGYNPNNDIYDQCEFCVKRSGVTEHYLSECINVSVEKSHFAGEDLIGNIVENYMSQLDNMTFEMEPMSSEVAVVNEYKIGVFKDYEGNVHYTKDGKQYFESLQSTIESKPKKKGLIWKVFNPFTVIYTEPKAIGAQIVYQDYKGKEFDELEEIYDSYLSIVNVPDGADFPASAIIKLFKHLKEDAFIKAASFYYDERLSNSVENMRLEYMDDKLPVLSFSNAKKDFQDDIYLAALEESYHRIKLASELKDNQLD